MRRHSRLLIHSVVLISAMFLWLNPFCLVPVLDAVGHHSPSPTDQGHSRHPRSLCDDHWLHAAGMGHDADITAKAGISVQSPSLAGLPVHQFSVATQSGLECGPLSALPSASRGSSKALYALHSVYLI